MAALTPATATAPAAQAAALPDCNGGLTLAFDGEDGAFDGMSHSGVLVVLRNLNAKACRAPGLPRLRMQDDRGRDLPIARRAPIGMHPGPVVLPVGVAPEAEVTAGLRWVSGNVYDHGRCLTPARVTIHIGAQTLTAAWPGGSICGPSTGPIPFDQSLLRVDPTL